jgi:hypothetical protein
MIEILAIVASPVIALVVQRVMSDRKEKRERRHRLFESLWITRGDLGTFGRMSIEHVRALNMLEIEFSRTWWERIADDDSPDLVVQAWGAYRTHLFTLRPQSASPSNPDAVELEAGAAWDAENDRLLTDVLYALSQSLGYNYGRDHIRFNAYAPIGYASNDLAGGEIKKAVLALATGQAALHVTTKAPAAQSPAAPLPGDPKKPVPTNGNHQVLSLGAASPEVDMSATME